MIGRTNAGGGGLGLSVKVHASAPESTQSGRENEIWVVSDTQSQYWAVKATEPTAEDFGEAELPNGTIWVKIENADPLCDIVKNRKIAVVLTSANCVQLKNGSWEYRDAYIYRDNVWTRFAMAFNGVLWDDGIRNVDFVGSIASGGSGGSFNSNYIYEGLSCIRIQAEYDGKKWFYFTKKIDVTNFSSLNVQIAGNGSNGTYIIVARDTSWNTKSVPTSAVANTYAKGNGIFKVDVSGLSGTYYIGCKVHDSTASTQVKIWLE